MQVHRAIAVEVLSPKGFGRIRLGRVDVSGASLVPFVSAVVEPGTEVRTEGWKGYNGLCEQGYSHHAINVSASGDPAHVSMPAVHRVASLLKRWLLGTQQGSVTAEYLDGYLNEFAFSFNRAPPDASVCRFCGSWNMPWTPPRPGTDLRAAIARHETTTSSGHCTHPATPQGE